MIPRLLPAWRRAACACALAAATLPAAAALVITAPGLTAQTTDLGVLGQTSTELARQGLRGAHAFQMEASVVNGFGASATVTSPVVIDSVLEATVSGIRHLAVAQYDAQGNLRASVTATNANDAAVASIGREFAVPATTRFAVIGLGEGRDGGRFTMAAQADGSTTTPVPAAGVGPVGDFVQSHPLGVLGADVAAVSVSGLQGAFAFEFSFDLDAPAQLFNRAQALFLREAGDDLVLSRISELAIGLYNPDGSLESSVAARDGGDLNLAELFLGELSAGVGYRLAVIGFADGTQGGAFNLTLDADLLEAPPPPSGVPEPGSLALLALALALAGLRRARRAQWHRGPAGE